MYFFIITLKLMRKTCTKYVNTICLVNVYMCPKLMLNYCNFLNIHFNDDSVFAI